MKDKDNWNFVFEGIGEDFEEYWEIKKKDYLDQNLEEGKKGTWNNIVEWIDEYSELMRSIIPENQVECLIETKQEYKDFTKKEIISVLESLGKVSNLMYCASRDIFDSVYGNKILEKYYIYALEQITWRTASFHYKSKAHCDFTSLKEVVEKGFK
jgi:hypothetical protein